MRSWRWLAALGCAVVGAIVPAAAPAAGLPEHLVLAQPFAAACPGTDEFDGDALGARWSVLRPAGSGPVVAGGKLALELRPTDFIATTATGENAVVQDAPAGGWTATAKLDIAGIDTNGEQAGLLVWKSEGPGANAFAKITFIQTSSGSAGTRQFEAIYTENSVTTFPTGGPSAAPAPADLPADADVYVRAVSDGTTVHAEYSLDGTTFTRFGQTARLNGALKVGMIGLRGANGGGNAVFDRFELSCGPEVSVTASTTRGKTPLEATFTATQADDKDSDLPLSWDFGDGTAPAAGPATTTHTFAEPGTYRVKATATDQDGNAGAATATVVAMADPACPVATDEFNGNALDPRWAVLRPMPSGVSVADGQLRLLAYGGDMSNGTATARNVLVRPAPQGAWTASTKIDVSQLGSTGDQVGLMLWRGENPNTFTKIVWNRRGANSYWFERSGIANGTSLSDNGNAGTNSNPPATVYIRVRSDGASTPTFTAESSTDGTTWTAVRSPFKLDGPGALRFGLTYFQASALKTAGFDYFRVDAEQPCSAPEEVDAPSTTAALDPAAPDGADGWYTRAPRVTLNASDGEGSGVEKTEYRIDGGSWRSYLGPFSLAGAGRHTVEYRSLDKAGNQEATRTLTAKVDAAAPHTTVAYDPAQPGAGGTYQGPVTLKLTATDPAPGAGVAKTEYRVDGGAWQDATATPPTDTILDGTQASFDKWLQAPAAGFTLQPDGSIRANGGLGMLWYPVKQYSDFALKFQFRDARTDSDYANGGAFVRFPDPRTPQAERDWACNTGNAQSSQAWVAIYCGHEIQVYDGPSGETQKTGSIYNFQPLTLAQARTTPKGEWNDYEIRVVGQTYTIVRNGVTLNVFENAPGKTSSRAGDPPTAARQFAKGFIGLQNHSAADAIEYRDVRVEDLSVAPTPVPITVTGDGRHTVEYRSTDAAGRVEQTRSTAFRIGAAAGACSYTDTFDGTALDMGRWSVLRPADTGLEVANGNLNLQIRAGELFTGTATAENVVLQDAPAGGWVATTRFNVADVNENGEQAGLALWKSEGDGTNTFAKATFIQTSSGAAGTRQFEAIYTDTGALAFPIGAPSAAPAPAGLPADGDVYLRFVSDGATVYAQYSVDGTAWTRFGQTARIAGPVKVGLLAIRGAGGPSGTVAFDEFSLSCGPQVSVAASAIRGESPLSVDFTSSVADDRTAAPELSWDFGDGTTATGGAAQTHDYTRPGAYRVTLTATDGDGNTSVGATTVVVSAQEPPCPAASDEFSGNALDPKWEIRRPVPSNLAVTGGMLRVNPQPGDYHQGNGSVRNTLLQPVPAGAWTATTRIDTSQLATGDQVGLVLWRSEAPNHFAKVVFLHPGDSAWWFERNATNNGSSDAGNGTVVVQRYDAVYLRVSATAEGVLQARYSLDGDSWTDLRAPFSIGGEGPLKAGVAYWGSTGLRSAGFDWFHLQDDTPCPGPSDKEAPAATHVLDPATPDGAGGWYTHAPQLTLAADDGEGSGVERVEYRFGASGAWQTYEQPVTVADGTRTVEYRATDRAGNVSEAKSIDVKVDTAAPAVSPSIDSAAQGQGGWYVRSPLSVTLAGDDGAGSGVAKIEYRLDDGAWQAYAGAIDLAGDGEHRLGVRATDNAGNAGTETVVPVKLDATAPVTRAALDPAAAPRTGPVTVSVSAQDGASGVAWTAVSVDGDDWATYDGPLTLSARGEHTVKFRSVDAAGNAEEPGSVTFSIVAPTPLPAPTATPTPEPARDATPAPAPKPWLALDTPARRATTASALAKRGLRVDARCAGVSRVTVTLTLTKADAKRLKLKRRKVASKRVTCGANGHIALRLKPSKRAAKALKRTRRAVNATLTVSARGAKTDRTSLTFGKARR